MGSVSSRPDDAGTVLGPGDFVRIAYRLGRSAATGVASIEAPGRRTEILVLRRGHLMTAEADAGARRAGARLATIAALPQARLELDGGAAAYPPGAAQRQLDLAGWAREHLERQVDVARARALAMSWAGARLRLDPRLAPAPRLCDATDLRILAAMRAPRRLEQIASLARTPRFRLIAFIHFLRAVGAVELAGVAAPGPEAAGDAHRVLGVEAGADRIAVKRAFRRLARALHPDLHPDASAERRHALGRKLAEVTAAYRRLAASAPL
jgi:DnaJ-domain-containing protein 1